MCSAIIPSPEHSPENVFKALLIEAASEQAVKDQFGAMAKTAMVRLAGAVYDRRNGQALKVAACLASIYNGADAREVRLDEIRWLDWTFQRDLVTVLLGTGSGGCRDVDICSAFAEVGGADAVKWFHWYIDGGPHRAALQRIVAAIAEQPYCSSSNSLRAALRAIHNGSAANIAKLMYVEDRGDDLVLVLEGVIGRHTGCVRENDI